MTELRQLKIRVPRKEVLRNLGYRRGAGPRERVDRRLDELWSGAEDRLRPRGAYRLVDGGEAGAAGMPDPSDTVAVGLCTVGDALEQECHRLTEAGELLDALLLDAFGSSAAEASADALNVVLCRELVREGRHPAPRISPGYGRWDVRGQRDLLALLPAGELGIRLTEGLMMVPRKSVSFAVRLQPQPQPGGARGGARRCALCEMEDCAYRRPADGGRQEP